MYKTVEIHYSQSRKEKDHRKMKHCAPDSGDVLWSDQEGVDKSTVEM
jgi:hypothetical protein